MDSNFHKHVDEALSRISNLIRKTPLQYSPSLSEKTGSEVYLKLENFQVTGSFKARGAANKLMILSKDKLRCLLETTAIFDIFFIISEVESSEFPSIANISILYSYNF